MKAHLERARTGLADAFHAHPVWFVVALDLAGAVYLAVLGGLAQ